MPKISVLTSTFRPGGLDITLAGMRDQTFKDFELIIVDKRYDKRHSEVMKLAKEYGVNTIHVPEHRINGKWNTFCSGWNTAFALAQGEYFIIIGDYTYIHPGTIEAHLRAHEVPNRYVLAPYIYTAMPEFVKPYTKNKDEQLQRGSSCTENDDVIDGGIIEEMFAFKKGPFDPAWIPDLPPSPPPDQDIRAGYYPQSRYLDSSSGIGWLHVKYESAHRDVFYKFNGLDERLERGKGPMDLDLETRLSLGGVNIWWDTSIPPGITPNPRWYCRNVPWGAMSERLSGRWSYDDGLSYIEQRKKEIQSTVTEEEKDLALRAKNTYSLDELSKRLSFWRLEENHPVRSIDVDDTMYWGKEIWPDTPVTESCHQVSHTVYKNQSKANSLIKELPAEKLVKWTDPAQTSWLQRQVWPPPGQPGICNECGGGTFIELGGASSNNADFGGGASYHPNLDIRDMPGVDMVWDLETGKIPYHDNHADRIKMVHVINHLKKVTADKILQECLRVLKPNGVLFIMVTDMQFVLGKALEDNMSDSWATCIWGTRGDTYDADFHYWGYTPNSLKELLYDIGFRHVINCGNPNAWEFRMNAVK